MSAAAQHGFFSRTWQRYLGALKQRPIRTKSVTSASLYVVADCIAQFGIEGRSFAPKSEEVEAWDGWRTARLTFYGGCIFAPLAHNWLRVLDTFKASTRLRTLGLRLTIDSFLWSPFVCALFPTTLTLLEGNGFENARKKVEMGWLPTWQKAVMVFGPTQVFNLALVPTQHRLLVLQFVGMCWNVFLSYQNNVNNRILAAANAALANAHTVTEQLEAQRRIDAAELRKEELKKKQGGEVGVATKLSWS